MKPEELDRINRAEEIQRYTENRCEALEKENAELKAVERMALYSKMSHQLAQAKDLIRNLLRVTYGEGWNYSLDWKVQAEQFLKEE